MNVSIVLVFAGGSEYTLERVLSFRFEKEAYLPYTIMNASFLASHVVTGEVTEIKLYIGSQLVHYGTADILETKYKGGCYHGRLTSRSFTSMLLQNQLEPGMYTHISLNSLMDGFITIPHVTHENSADTSGYIYVKEGCDQWDGIVNLCYKQQQTYPYIRGTNCVMFTPETSPLHINIGIAKQLEVGTRSEDKRIISDWHMADIDDTYGSFDYHVQAADSKGIVRHRYFELDKQYLYDPMKALYFRAAYAQRGMRSEFCTYNGYSGEDLYDIVTFGDISGRVCRLIVTGTESGIITKASIYHDAFHA